MLVKGTQVIYFGPAKYKLSTLGLRGYELAANKVSPWASYTNLSTNVAWFKKSNLIVLRDVIRHPCPHNSID